jgi:hypothetical protein
MARSVEDAFNRRTPTRRRHSDQPELHEYHLTAHRGCPWGHQAPGPCQESSYWCENLRSAQVPETPTQRGPRSQSRPLGHPSTDEDPTGRWPPSLFPMGRLHILGQKTPRTLPFRLKTVVHQRRAYITPGRQPT